MIKRTLFFSNPAYLSTKNEQMLVQFPDKEKEPVTVPIEDIGFVVLEHPQITITHKLIGKLLANKTAVITCDDRRMPSGILQPYEGHTEQSKRIRAQLNMSKPLKDNLWKQTIQSKIKNQSAVLKSRDKEYKKLDYWSKMVTSGDRENHEAFASAYYWQTLLGTDFRRDRYGSSPNNLLNYGYAILRAVTARALTSTGLLPTLGLFHKNKYNAYCLADDMMEPYCPYVDAMVCHIIDSGTNIDDITLDVKQELLQIPAMDVRIGKRCGPLMTAMSRTTNSLYECMIGKKRKILYPDYDA